MYFPWIKSKLKKTYSFKHLLVFCLASTIGPSMMLLSGQAIDIAGDNVLFSLILIFIFTFFAGLLYAEMSSTIKMTGGEFTYMMESEGGVPSFLTGWLIWFGNITFMALNAIGFGQIMASIFPAANAQVWATVTILVFSIIQYMGKKTGFKIQTIILGFILVSLVAPLFFSTCFFVPKISDMELVPLLNGASFMFIFFLTFQNVVNLNEESKKPSKNIPKSIILTIGIAFLIYFFLFSAILGNGLGDLASFFENKVPYGGIFFTIALAMATLSALNTMFVSSIKNCYSLSKEGFIPKSFSKLGKDDIPKNTVMITAFLAIMIASSGLLDMIANVINLVFVLAAMSVAYSSIQIRKKRKELKIPFKAGFYPIPQIFVLLFSTIMLLFVQPNAILISALWIVIGIFLYILKVAGIRRLQIAFGGMNVLVFTAMGVLLCMIGMNMIIIQSLEILIVLGLGVGMLISGMAAFVMISSLND